MSKDKIEVQDNYAAGALTSEVMDEFTAVFGKLVTAIKTGQAEVEAAVAQACDPVASTIATCVCLSIVNAVRQFGPILESQILFGMDVGLQRASEILGAGPARPIDKTVTGAMN